MKNDLNANIKRLMDDSEFQNYLEKGDALNSLSFAKGYLYQFPEIYKLLDTIVKSTIKAMV